MAGQQMVAVGKVAKAAGTVEVQHPDGTRSTLQAGDIIYQGDVVVTKDASSSVAITFVDSSTLSLGKSGRMVIDELVYDPATQTGHSTVSVVKGAFSLVSGQIAKSAPDAATLKTPVMTIGIRGTSVAGTADGEGEANTIVLLQDPDGTLGQVVVSTAGGSVVINQANFLTQVSSYSQPPSAPVYTPASQILSSYGEVISNQPNAPAPSTAPPPATTPEAPQQQQTADPVGDTTSLQSSPPPVTVETVGPVAPVEVPPIPTPPVPDPIPVRERQPDPQRNDPQPQQQQSTENPGGDTNHAPEVSGTTIAIFVMDESNPPSVSGILYTSDPEETPVSSTYTQASALGGAVTVTDDGYGTLTWTYVPPTGIIVSGTDQDSFTITVTDADGASTTQTIKLYANLSPNTNPPTLTSGVTSVTAPANTWTPVFSDGDVVAGDSDSTYVMVKISLKSGWDDERGQIRCTIGQETITADETITLVVTASQLEDLLKTLEYKGSADEEDAINVKITDDGETWISLQSDVSVTATAPASSDFTGSASQDFSTEANWSAGRPGSVTDATISGASFDVLLAEDERGRAGSLAVTDGAALDIAGDLRVENLFSLDTGSTLSVSGELHAATIELHGSTTIDDGTLVGEEAIWIYGNTTVLNAADFTGATHVEAGGTLTVSGSGTSAQFQSLANLGSIHLASGATLAVTASGSSFQNSNLLWGDGTIAFENAGSLSNDGTLRPGGDNEIGHLTIDGSATLGDSSVIEIDLRDTSSHDIMTFGNAVSLNGGLNLNIDPDSGPYGYEATPTAIIEGVNSGTWFDSVSLASTSNGNGVVGVWFDGSDVLAKSAVFASSTTATYEGSNFGETIFGARDLSNSIDAGDGDDFIQGGGLNDTLTGGTGNDSILGGDGDDTIYADGGDVIDGGDGIDTVRFSIADFSNSFDYSAIASNISGVEKLYIQGTSGADVFYGGDLDDTIDTLGGSDFLNAGDGDDLVIVYDHLFSSLGGGTGTDTLQWQGNATLDLSQGIMPDHFEIIKLAGTGGGLKLDYDSVAANSDSGALTIIGTAGNSVSFDESTGWTRTAQDASYTTYSYDDGAGHTASVAVSNTLDQSQLPA